MIGPGWASNPVLPITIARQRILRRYQQHHRGRLSHRSCVPSFVGTGQNCWRSSDLKKFDDIQTSITFTIKYAGCMPAAELKTKYHILEVYKLKVNKNLYFLRHSKPQLTISGSLDRRLADSLCSHCWHHCKRVVGPANVLSLSASSRSRFSRRTADATTLSAAGTRDLPFTLLLCNAPQQQNNGNTVLLMTVEKYDLPTCSKPALSYIHRLS